MTRTNTAIDPELRRRSSLIGRLRTGLRHPTRVLPYWRRMLRNRSLRASSNTHTEFYRGVMADNASRSPDAAIGSDSREHWLKVGRIHFDYLVAHGLRPEHRVLDIGCGNLRGGWRLIQYLDSGNYYGIDISPAILLAALKEVRDQDLQEKSPYLVLVDDLTFDFLAAEAFDVIHAHGVFMHTRADVIEQCLASVGRVLKPDGFFDLTYLDGKQFSLADENFCYPTEMLLELAARYQLAATPMDDWDYSQHRQQKLRLRRTNP
jgi:SAM-dependent methyltransferase